MVDWLAGKRVRGTSSERTPLGVTLGGTGVGGWVELGRTTLGSAGDLITITSLAEKRYYMILGDFKPIGGIARPYVRVGNGSIDSGSNYARRGSLDGGADGQDVSKPELRWENGIRNPYFQVGYAVNKSSNEKLFLEHGVGQNTAGATNTPYRGEHTGKWANTSNVFDQYQRVNTFAGSWDTGSEVVVLGWDPADTHTNNFWEELASVDLSGGAADEISSGTITAKKYLWVQCYTESSGTQRQFMRFNNDTGTNYARRWSENGGTDGTSTSQTAANIMGLNDSGTGTFSNTFIINNSSNEKLIISHGVSGTTAGAANAPQRTETVNKWANTSNQITEIDIINPESGDFGTKSFLKVWGAD